MEEHLDLCIPLEDVKAPMVGSADQFVDAHEDIQARSDEQCLDSIQHLKPSSQESPEIAGESEILKEEFALGSSPSILQSSKTEKLFIGNEGVNVCVKENEARQDTGSLLIEDVSIPINKVETIPETQLQALEQQKEGRLEANYSLDHDKSTKQATVFEKVKGFIFGKPNKQQQSKATIDTTTDTLTSLQISSEPKINVAKMLSEDKIKKDLAPDISTPETINEPLVSVNINFDNKLLKKNISLTVKKIPKFFLILTLYWCPLRYRKNPLFYMKTRTCGLIIKQCFK